MHQKHTVKAKSWGYRNKINDGKGLKLDRKLTTGL